MSNDLEIILARARRARHDGLERLFRLAASGLARGARRVRAYSPALQATWIPAVRPLGPGDRPTR
jgi:hypothetical protein